MAELVLSSLDQGVLWFFVRRSSAKVPEVRRDATMCSLISARILDIGSTTSPAHGSAGGP